MKCFILVIAALILTGCSTWSKRDIALESVYAVAHVADWSQTRYISRNAYHPTPLPPQYRLEKLHETNPILGRHPHKDTVDIYMVSTLLFHVLATDFIEKYRLEWQGVSIGLELGISAYNLNAGYKIRF